MPYRGNFDAMRVIRFSLFLVAVMLVIVVGTIRGADDAERLFSPAERPIGGPAANGGHALRQRTVKVEMALLGAPAGQGDIEGRALQLDLFGGATVTAVPERIESPAAGQVIWQGQVQGQALNTVTIAVRATPATLAGRALTGCPITSLAAVTWITRAARSPSTRNSISRW